MDPLVITLPYVSTATQTVNSVCGWYASVGGTLVNSGLGYQGQRVVDTNEVVVNYRRIVTGCASCVTWTTSGETTDSMTVRAKYANRATYSVPPVYMSIRRNPAATYNNWTWEITGGQFIIKNASGVTQSTYNLSTRTLAQAVVAIDADPAIIALGPVAPLPADSLPATLMYDRAATLIPITPAANVWLVPIGNTVEYYQDGQMSPSWRIGSLAGNPVLLEICAQEFPLKAGCGPTSDPYDYTGGTDAAAEAIFCNGIGTRFLDWTTQYNPRGDINDGCLGWQMLGGIGFGGTVNNYPLGYYDCAEDGLITWVETTPCEPDAGAWDLVLGAYGNLATTVANGTTDMCSDSSVIDPTYCYTQADRYDCDFCSCGPDVGKGCVKTTHREGWRVFKSFKIERL
jgi:hypothetical protein